MLSARDSAHHRAAPTLARRLMERADAALYDSKRAGGNRVTAAWPVD